MDLSLYSRVFWRFRLLVVAGLMLASALAVVSYFRVSLDGFKPKLTYRQTETWQGRTRLLVTQQGFPLGRSVFPPTTPEGTPQFASPARFSELAVLYANLANSDQIVRLIEPSGRLRGSVGAQVVSNPTTGYTLPIIDLFGVADTPKRAVDLTRRAADALRSYIYRGQVASRTPATERVTIQELARPKEAELIVPRKKTVPVTVFLSVLIATIALVFVLENLRPRITPLQEREGAGREQPGTRRSA